MDDKIQRQQEKREARRKRRIRNQIVVYVVMITLVVAAATGIVYGINFVTQYSKSQEKSDQDGQKEQDGVENESSQQPQDSDKQDIPDETVPSEEASPTPEPTPEVVEPTPEEKLNEEIDARIEVMTLEEKVAGLFIVTPEAITGVDNAVRAGETTRQALAKYAVGGIVYFGNNIQSEEQLKEMLHNTMEYAKYPLFLAVDEEGGSVARIASAGIGPKVEGAGVIGATKDTDKAYQAGVTIGSSLAGIGFNLDFAPVADLANVEGSVMEARSYGADAAAVSGFVISMMNGLKEQGVTSCLKHFPGIGSTTADTHEGKVSTDRSAEQFWAEEFVVFQDGINAGAEMVMVSHMEAPGLTGNNEPCIFSEALVTDILRRQMGFNGIIITDALNMAAISNYYGADEAAVMALLAGCDMLLMPEDFDKAYNGVMEAVRNGHISEERINDALRRIYKIKYADTMD